jgi:hypothetical protein
MEYKGKSKNSRRANVRTKEMIRPPTGWGHAPKIPRSCQVFCNSICHRITLAETRFRFHQILLLTLRGKEDEAGPASRLSIKLGAICRSLESSILDVMVIGWNSKPKLSASRAISSPAPILENPHDWLLVWVLECGFVLPPTSSHCCRFLLLRG